MSSLKLVQYVVVRRDLIDTLQWPLGAVIAQACHASTAIIHLSKEDKHTKLYLDDLESMHKVVLEAKNQSELEDLSQKLTENNVQHKLWVEHPENYPTCLAIKPSPRDDIRKYLKKFKLFS